MFICGFTRGGTTWLRSIVGSHPHVCEIKKELVVFRDRPTCEKALERINEHWDGSPFIVEKSPASAKYLSHAFDVLPEAKYVFVIRDPRDCFISHLRSTRPWTDGGNSTIEGCLGKLRSYWESFATVRHVTAGCVVQYENIHKDFSKTIGGLFQYIGLDYDSDLLESIRQSCSFKGQTGREAGLEDRGAAKRKGIVGDWKNYLSNKDATWLMNEAFWGDFMQSFGYG